MKSCFRHEIKKATVGNLLHLKIQVCSSCKNTCCVLANLSQISQHGAHTPLVPIILHFRIRAPRNERGKVKFVQSQSIQMQEIQLGPLLTVFIAENTHILFSLEYLLLEAHRPWDVEGGGGTDSSLKRDLAWTDIYSVFVIQYIPYKVCIFLVDAVVGQMHTYILDVFTRLVIFYSGKPARRVYRKQNNQKVLISRLKLIFYFS